MKIKPIEKSLSKKAIIIRIIILSSLIIGGFLYYQYFGKNIKKNSQVLSEETKNNIDLKTIDQNTETFIKKISDGTKKVTDNVLGEATKIYQNTTETIASKSSEIVNDLIFNSTIKPILDQYEKLPEEQKEKIKKDICN